MLSVVVPARNSASWIGELLESLLAQDVDSAEYIVVDNASTDETSELVAGLSALDARIRVVTSLAGSAAGARNEGVACATGEYLAFADADDLVPAGAHRALLESLAASGSDMAIGDHLKFSPTRTWSPTQRWYSFGTRRSAVRPDEVPELISGRACWNRMFRRRFWDEAGLTFPEIPSVDDIEPMTRAFVVAERIDVVDHTVYLYRDREDGHAISKRADLSTTMRYLEQEVVCAALVRDSPSLAAAHASVVLDADGWAHLARFSSGSWTPADIEELRPFVAALVAAIPLDGLCRVAPSRRTFWSLVVDGRLSEALTFAAALGDDDATVRLRAWCSGLAMLSNASHSAIDVPALVRDGLLPTLVNDADAVAPPDLAAMLGILGAVTSAEPAAAADLPRAMLAALREGRPADLVTVSALRRAVPLVVDRVDAGPVALEIAGTTPHGQAVPRADIVLVSADEVVPVPLFRDEPSARWVATVPAGPLSPGRWQVGVRFAGVSGVFPVVTARMPLPPVGAGHVLQPLADRQDGWRFLIDRRQEESGFRALIARIRRRQP